MYCSFIIKCLIFNKKRRKLICTPNKNHKKSSQNKSNIVSTHCTKNSQHASLSMAKIFIFDRKAQQYVCRVLLDSGSQSNLITRALVDKLHLTCKSVNIPISGIKSKTRVNQLSWKYYHDTIRPSLN